MYFMFFRLVYTEKKNKLRKMTPALNLPGYAKKKKKI